MSGVISIVMPAHDEEPFLASAVRQVAEGMRTRGEFEVIVVENGSTDATADVGKALMEEIPELRVLSLGAADYGKALASSRPGARWPPSSTWTTTTSASSTGPWL